MPKRKTGRRGVSRHFRAPSIISVEKKSASIHNYLEHVVEQPTETAKAQRFMLLLSDLFNEAHPRFIEDYLKGMERYVRAKEKDILIRGRIDTLYGNLIIEFERSLFKTLAEANEQLRTYVAALWSDPKERGRSYLAVATDGINFIVYAPTATNLTHITQETIRLDEIERVDLHKLRPEDTYFWLDRYLFREYPPQPPRTVEFVRDFGAKSAAFRLSSNVLLQLLIDEKHKKAIQVIYNNWQKYLRVTYGGLVGDEELFVRHTYLAILAKLMVWRRLSEEAVPVESDTIYKILDGRFFSDAGLVNFLEEDFFSWAIRISARESTLSVSKKLLRHLYQYDIRRMSEDVLKGLYQELVDPEARHDLGEYYTPDWLAEEMIRKLLEDNPSAAVLDPACGSGTFLYHAIRHKRAALTPNAAALTHITHSVMGFDIHPLAVIIAKTNYLLALGDLLRKRRGSVTIPVYLADSLKHPERETHRDLFKELPAVRIDLEERRAYVPEAIIAKSEDYDASIEAAKEYAVNFADRKDASEAAFGRFLERRVKHIADDPRIVKALFNVGEVLRKFVEEDRDTIWAYILKNVFKPVFVRGTFDIVVGNPPWLAYRYVEKGEYQAFLKHQIRTVHQLLTETGKFLSHMELATLFYVHCADLYLKDGGVIGFVLPRSIFTADQHNNFRTGRYRPEICPIEIWDLEGVDPLFKVPSCVVFGQKRSGHGFPVNVKVWAGNLGGERNPEKGLAESRLNCSSTHFYLHKGGGGRTHISSKRVGDDRSERSPYGRAFQVGAMIFPRSFWFVQPRVHPRLGMDPTYPNLETDERAIKEAKARYKSVRLSGRVESDFIFGTLISTDIVPFGNLAFRLLVLPLAEGGDGPEVIDSELARRRGHTGLATWLSEVEQQWKRLRGGKAEKITIYERLNHWKLLTRQRRSRYTVVYPSSATHVCATVVKRQPLQWSADGSTIVARSFIVDHMLHYLDTDNEAEANYLSAMLNSSIVDEALKPLQARGLFGPRHIHKKVWEAGIPIFDGKKGSHIRLAEVGGECTKKATALLSKVDKSRSIAWLRKLVKDHLRDELSLIDSIVNEILG